MSPNTVPPTARTRVPSTRNTARESPPLGNQPKSNPISVQDVDDAVKQALRDSWDLPVDSQNVPDRTDRDSSEDSQGSSARSLDELYKSMDELGLSVDDLTEALNDAYRGT